MLLTLLFFAPLGWGCAATRLTPPILAALDCAQVIPPSYRQPIAPAPLISPDATAGQALTALDDQTTRLDMANGRSADLVAIADGCQARQAAVLDALQPHPWWDGLAARLKPPARNPAPTTPY